MTQFHKPTTDVNEDQPGAVNTAAVATDAKQLEVAVHSVAEEKQEREQADDQPRGIDPGFEHLGCRICCVICCCIVVPFWIALLGSNTVRNGRNEVLFDNDVRDGILRAVALVFGITGTIGITMWANSHPAQTPEQQDEENAAPAIGMAHSANVPLVAAQRSSPAHPSARRGYGATSPSSDASTDDEQLTAATKTATSQNRKQ